MIRLLSELMRLVFFCLIAPIVTTADVPTLRRHDRQWIVGSWCFNHPAC